MMLEDTGLHRQPFQTRGKPLVLVPYGSQKAAIRFLNETRFDNRGLGLFHGPPLSGKTSVIHQFTTLLSGELAVAVVDGANIEAGQLLQEVLAQFGYDQGFDSANERFNMLKVFAMQQTASGQAPVLIVENFHAMTPVGLEMICDLAELTIGGENALRIILVSHQPMLPMVEAPAMESISRRVTGKFLLQPLTRKETAEYVYCKLKSGGCKNPQFIVPQTVCDRLHMASGGWPGIVDRLALLAISRADRWPLSVDHIARRPSPESATKRLLDSGRHLILTHRHKTLTRVALDGTRLLIGRNEHCDLHIDGEWISRQHAMLFRKDDTTIVVDLKSRNGVYVNGQRIAKQVLVNNDIISLGDHRVKFIDPSATHRRTLSSAGWDDTTIAKCIKNFRSGLASRSRQKTAS